MQLAIFGELANRFRVDAAFDGEDSGCEGVGGVVGFDGDAALEDDGAVVVLVVCKVDGAAADFAAPLKDSVVYAVAVEALAAKRR